jgi:cbb3-type cytochrome oxidase maturation protein
MGIIVLLICISLTIAIAFLATFYWSIKSGQYEDTYTPSVRMLFEDKLTKDGAKKDEVRSVKQVAKDTSSCSKEC